LGDLTAAVVRRGIDPQSLGSEQGQTLVEFALILPILLLLVVGMFDFGSAFNQKNELNFLANAAARYAEVNSCTGCASNGKSTIAKQVQGTASGLGSTPSITFCLAPRPDGVTNDGSVGNPLKVTANVPFNWLGVNIPGLPTGPLAGGLTSSVTVRILQAPNPPDSSGSAPLYDASPC
jgi:Flp pilus assembly protein TadG